MAELVLVATRVIFAFLPTVLLLSVVLLTGNDKAKINVEKLLVLSLERTRIKANQRGVHFIKSCIASISTASIPIVTLTTILSIPVHDNAGIGYVHDIIDRNFWALLIVAELFTFVLLSDWEELKSLDVSTLKKLAKATEIKLFWIAAHLMAAILLLYYVATIPLEIVAKTYEIHIPSVFVIILFVRVAISWGHWFSGDEGVWKSRAMKALMAAVLCGSIILWSAAFCDFGKAAAAFVARALEHIDAASHLDRQLGRSPPH